MKVILLKDVQGTGKKDQIVEVSDGFGRNYLLPRKMAVEATAEAVHSIESAKQAEKHRADVKRDEAGLAEYAGDSGAQLVFYSAEELSAVPGDFAESEFVKKTVGVGNVCERAAVLGAGIGELLIGKTAHDGVTVAAAVRDWRVEF